MCVYVCVCIFFSFFFFYKDFPKTLTGQTIRLTYPVVSLKITKSEIKSTDSAKGHRPWNVHVYRQISPLNHFATRHHEPASPCKVWRPRKIDLTAKPSVRLSVPPSSASRVSAIKLRHQTSVIEKLNIPFHEHKMDRNSWTKSARIFPGNVLGGGLSVPQMRVIAKICFRPSS